MAYTLKMGAFVKLENSTAQPNTTGWAEFSVTLKEGCDLSNPVLSIAESFATISAYNYAAFLGRYYWIQDIRVERTGYCMISMKVDVLATYKTDIGNADLYVLRSSAARNGAIRDNFYPILSNYTTNNDVLDDATGISFSTGVYVVNIVGTQTGSSTLFQFTPAQFSTFVNNLLGYIANYQPVAPGTSTDVTEAVDKLVGMTRSLFESVKMSVFDPMRYIASVMWFPHGGFITGASVPVYVGLWNSGTTALIITDPISIQASYTISIPKHPQSSSRGQYLNMEPFSHYSIEFDPFGVVPIDAAQLVGASSFNLAIYADAMTGMGILKCRIPGGQVLTSIAAQWGVPLPLSGASVGSGAVLGTASAIGEMIAGASTGNTVMMAHAMESGIGSALEAIHGTVSTMGSSGSYAAHWQPKVFHAVFHNVAPEDNTQHGAPLMDIRKPSVLTGFMIVADGYVPISGPLPEQLEIKRILETGFFYE